MKKLKEKYINIIESRDWSVVCYTDDGRVELEWYSPAGECICMCVEVENFPKSVYEYYSDFDVDEHITMWIDAKKNGVSGVPDVRTLVHDAEDIKNELLKLSNNLLACNLQ